MKISKGQGSRNSLISLTLLLTGASIIGFATIQSLNSKARAKENSQALTLVHNAKWKNVPIPYTKFGASKAVTERYPSETTVRDLRIKKGIEQVKPNYLGRVEKKPFSKDKNRELCFWYQDVYTLVDDKGNELPLDAKLGDLFDQYKEKLFITEKKVTRNVEVKNVQKGTNCPKYDYQKLDG